MRVLHTSDWHLGHTLHGMDRYFEHESFLDWLVHLVVERECDVLIIAGDIFDSSNPPARAQALWYSFLARVHAVAPELDIVVISGNHDSPARLHAPSELLRALRVHVVGVLPRIDGDIDIGALMVPVSSRGRGCAGWVAAVPFLRPSDLPVAGDELRPDCDPLIAGVARVYAAAAQWISARRQPGQSAIALGHCFMVGTSVSQLSERRILGGNQHALPASVFDDSWSYVALGHMHKAQRVGRDSVRYCGSPIPLAMTENRYRHAVTIVDIDGSAVSAIDQVAIPRFVELIRLPTGGPQPLPKVLEQLAQLPNDDEDDVARRPFLEVRVLLDCPQPDVRTLVEAALASKRPRLVKLSVEYTGVGAALADVTTTSDLRELDPEDVFVAKYQREHEDQPSDALLSAFRNVLNEARVEVER